VHLPLTVSCWRNAKLDGEPVGYHSDVRYFVSVNFPTKRKRLTYTPSDHKQSPIIFKLCVNNT
jgi:hypothetical protein